MTNQAATKPLHLDMHEQIECAQTLASRFYHFHMLLNEFLSRP